MVAFWASLELVFEFAAIDELVAARASNPEVVWRLPMTKDVLNHARIIEVPAPSGKGSSQAGSPIEPMEVPTDITIGSQLGLPHCHDLAGSGMVREVKGEVQSGHP